ncbi:molybdopterin-dependent oxidoreductase [Fodinicurvata sediminis]|uniref:molybdopterin-dependent oxidoreductase n=1 Tax=Fodinicurvata sediminis TaxID=1121832 RepID=UPI001B7FB6E3|nr:molybdopterin-dependent oxidoreductase [Fodinicurvata sediminis]
MSSVRIRKLRAVKETERGRFHALAFFPTVVLTMMLAMGAVSAGASELPSPTGEVLLTVTGNIGQTNDGDRALFDREMLETLPSQTLETRTVVTDGVKTFDGVLMRDLLAWVEAEGETVTASALNDYVIEIPMEDFHDFDVVAATHMDGERLSPRDKGPLWIVYPRDDHEELQDIRYDYRWVWQLIQLEIE